MSSRAVANADLVGERRIERRLTRMTRSASPSSAWHRALGREEDRAREIPLARAGRSVYRTDVFSAVGW